MGRRLRAPTRQQVTQQAAYRHERSVAHKRIETDRIRALQGVARLASALLHIAAAGAGGSLQLAGDFQAVKVSPLEVLQLPPGCLAPSLPKD